VDQGDEASCPGADQRGRPRPQLAAYDIGAIEMVFNAFLALITRE
jgi:hypothetical protein